MDALEYRIKQALTALIKEAFPDSSIPDFEFLLIGENKTFHGDYSKNKIRVGNLSRPPRQIILTCIHQIAHHCQYHLYDEEGHTEGFYKTYHVLLKTGCRMGIVSPQLIQSCSEDEASIRKAEKTYGPILDRPDTDKLYRKEYCLVSAFRSYHSRETLSENGYFYNGHSKAWEKQIRKDEAEQVKRHLIINGIEPHITDDVLDITVFVDISISGNTFPEKEYLKKHGYRFNSKIWCKRVQSSELKKEQEVFDHIKNIPDISYKVEY